MTPTVAPQTSPLKPPSGATLARAANLEKRNQALRDTFYARYTNQPRPRIYTREGVIAALAQEYHLSMATVERLVMPKGK